MALMKTKVSLVYLKFLSQELVCPSIKTMHHKLNKGVIGPNALTWALKALDILKWSNQILNSILTLGL
jgi:hypothetical protein